MVHFTGRLIEAHGVRDVWTVLLIDELLNDSYIQSHLTLRTTTGQARSHTKRPRQIPEYQEAPPLAGEAFQDGDYYTGAGFLCGLLESHEGGVLDPSPELGVRRCETSCRPL